MDPDYLAMCQQKQAHATRADARIEANNKTAHTGRRHDTYGCPLGHPFHVRLALAPAKKKRASQRRSRRYAFVGE